MTGALEKMRTYSSVLQGHDAISPHDDHGQMTTTGAPDVERLPSADDELRPMRADARRNRDRILAAARELFGKSGAEAQMDDVASVAGVGVGTVYRHFPTKEALIAELVRQKFMLFIEQAEEALQSDGQPFTVLAKLLRQNAEYLAGDAATRYAMGGGTSVWEATESERIRLGELISELIARGHRDRSLRPDLDVSDIPMVMCGVSSSMANGFDWSRHLDLVLDGIRGPAAR
jgi:AcrR family transcriptional regulator